MGGSERAEVDGAGPALAFDRQANQSGLPANPSDLPWLSDLPGPPSDMADAYAGCYAGFVSILSPGGHAIWV